MVKNYEPINDPCRLCGVYPPHEWRTVGERIEVVCLGCGALLDNLPAAAVLDVAIENAEAVNA